jgi:hypothetical protein
MHLLRSLALALTVTASLAACGGSSRPAPAEPAPAPEAAPMNEAPPEAPEVAEEPAPAPSEWTGSTGLPACDQYIAVTEAFAACDKVPVETRDAVRQGLDAMKQAWTDLSQLPPETKEQTNQACLQAVDALRQGATSMGCTI